MNIKITVNNDIDLLLDLRMEFIQDIHPEYSNEQLDKIKKGTYKFLSEQILNKTYVGFIVEVEKTIVSFASLLTYYYPPLLSEKYRKVGYVINFYTRKKYRKCGYGMKLMEEIKAYGKENDFYKIILTATESGYPLYKKSGFVDALRNMEFKIEN